MGDSSSAVIIYGAEWCPPCHTAKAYLKSRNINFQYINIEEQPDKGREIAEKTGWTAIPIIKIGDDYILGFDRTQVDNALTKNKLS